MYRKGIRQVFVAHSAQDALIAERIKTGLGSAGIQAWLYEHNTHLDMDVVSKVKQAIRMSRAMIAILSKGGADAVWVCTEVGMALANDLPVVALLEKNVFPHGIGPLQGRDGVLPFERGQETDACASAVRIVVEHIQKKSDNAALVLGVLAALAALSLAAKR